MGYIIGPLWLLCAALCFFLKRKEDEFRTMRRRKKLLGVFFTVFGLAGIAGQLLKNDFLILTAVLLSVGLLMLFAYFYSIYQAKVCTCEIDAVYTDYNRYSGGRGISRLAPVFDYDYEGVHYSRQTIESFSFKKLNRLFELRQTYTIYINPNAPECCISTKKASSSFIFLGILGIVFIALYFTAIL